MIQVIVKKNWEVHITSISGCHWVSLWNHYLPRIHFYSTIIRSLQKSQKQMWDWRTNSTSAWDKISRTFLKGRCLDLMTASIVYRTNMNLSASFVSSLVIIFILPWGLLEFIIIILDNFSNLRDFIIYTDMVMHIPWGKMSRDFTFHLNNLWFNIITHLTFLLCH